MSEKRLPRTPITKAVPQAGDFMISQVEVHRDPLRWIDVRLVSTGEPYGEVVRMLGKRVKLVELP